MLATEALKLAGTARSHLVPKLRPAPGQPLAGAAVWGHAAQGVSEKRHFISLTAAELPQPSALPAAAPPGSAAIPAGSWSWQSHRLSCRTKQALGLCFSTRQGTGPVREQNAMAAGRDTDNDSSDDPSSAGGVWSPGSGSGSGAAAPGPGRSGQGGLGAPLQSRYSQPPPA